MKIQTDTLQGFKAIHTWCGLLAGLLLFIAFYAGAITVFRDDIAKWQFAEQVLEKDAALEQLPQLIDQALALDERSADGLTILLPGGHNATPQAQWRVSEEKAYYARLTQAGEIELFEPSTLQLSRFIDELHRNAGIPGVTGEWLMGLAALLYGIAIISGVILFLPTFAKNIFALRSAQQIRRFWLDLHNSLGILSLPFHILFALTGAVMALHDPMFDAMNKLLYPDNGRQLLMQTVMPHMPEPVESVPAKMLAPKEILTQIEDQYPEFTPAAMFYSYPNTTQGYVSVLGHIPEHLAHQAMIVVSTLNGEVLATQLPDDRPHGIIALAGFRALHFGDFGGIAVEWLYFIMGLAGSILFYSGNLLWLEARRKKKQLIQKSTHTLLAKLTVGICLGCCLSVALAFLLSRTDLILGSQDFSLVTLYWSTIIFSLAWTSIRATSVAARELLLAIAVTALTIPCFSIGIAKQPLTNVDYTITALGGIFALTACVLHQRINRGEAHSVWGKQQTT